jgi:thiol-disulfide isomerase/thioredoxin
VVTIWASWCPGCNAEARTLARFAKSHPEAGFIGVDFSDTKDDARGFYEKYGWTFPSVFDPDGQIAGELGLQGTPTTIFLDREHREVARIVGETDEAGFAGGLEKANAGA